MFESYFMYVGMLKLAKNEMEKGEIIEMAEQDDTITYFEFVKLCGLAYPDA